MQEIDSLRNPSFRPTDAVLDRLNRAVAQEIAGRTQTEFVRGERKRLSDRLGMHAAHVNAMGAQLYLYKRRLKPGSREHSGQWLGLEEWRDRFEVMERLLVT